MFGMFSPVFKVLLSGFVVPGGRRLRRVMSLILGGVGMLGHYNCTMLMKRKGWKNESNRDTE